jgi:translation elongation factor EF-Tu-like GTPase
VGLFGKRSADDVLDLAPLRFRIEDVFVITARGPAFAGRVEAGTVRVGDTVRVELPDGPKPATVHEITVRGRRRDLATKGATAGLLLRGITGADLPAKQHGAGFVLDTQAVRDRLIVAAAS